MVSAQIARSRSAAPGSPDTCSRSMLPRPHNQRSMSEARPRTTVPASGSESVVMNASRSWCLPVVGELPANRPNRMFHEAGVSVYTICAVLSAGAKDHQSG